MEGLQQFEQKGRWPVMPSYETKFLTKEQATKIPNFQVKADLDKEEVDNQDKFENESFKGWPLPIEIEERMDRV